MELQQYFLMTDYRQKSWEIKSTGRNCYLSYSAKHTVRHKIQWLNSVWINTILRCYTERKTGHINKYQSNYFERSPRSYMGVILKTIIFSQKLPLPSSSLADEMVKMSLNWQVGILKSVIWGLYWVLSIRIHFSPLVTLEMRLFCTLPYNEIKYDQIIYIYLFVTQFN